MALSDLLAALSENTTVDVTVYGSNDAQIVTLNAPGYGALDPTLLTETVAKLTVVSGREVFVYLAS